MKDLEKKVIVDFNFSAVDEMTKENSTLHEIDGCTVV